jgi:hypothetical protein
MTQTSVGVSAPVCCSRVVTSVWGMHSRSIQCRNSRQPQLITTLAPPALIWECPSHCSTSLRFTWTYISARITLLLFLWAHPFALFFHFCVTSIWYVFRRLYIHKMNYCFYFRVYLANDSFPICFVCLWNDYHLLPLRINGAIPPRLFFLWRIQGELYRLFWGKDMKLEYKIVVFWGAISSVSGGGFLHFVWISCLCLQGKCLHLRCECMYRKQVSPETSVGLISELRVIIQNTSVLVFRGRKPQVL